MKLSSIRGLGQRGLVGAVRSIAARSPSPARAPQPVSAGESSEFDSDSNSAARDEQIVQAQRIGTLLNAKA